jgi:hypothetical protein
MWLEDSKEMKAKKGSSRMFRSKRLLEKEM